VKTIVIDRLAQSPDLKDKRIGVQVSKQVVTLDGALDTSAQKRAAEQIALQAPGVQNVVSQLTVADGAAAAESADDRLARRVEFELYSTKAVSLKTVQIRSQDGTVVLSGSVPSRAEKLLAERVAQSVEGVKKVVNNLSTQEPAAS
jgi:hyperosmotically inducible protein